jgi:hypothetical protein
MLLRDTPVNFFMMDTMNLYFDQHSNDIIPASPLASPEQIFNILNEIVSCPQFLEEQVTPTTQKKEFLVELPPLEMNVEDFFADVSLSDHEMDGSTASYLDSTYIPVKKNRLRKRPGRKQRSQSEETLTLYERRRRRLSTLSLDESSKIIKPQRTQRIVNM